MSLLASWECLATDDLGPSPEPGKRRVKVSTVCTLSNGEMRYVTTRLDLTPDELASWERAMRGRSVRP